MADFKIKFVFGNVDDCLRRQLQIFWHENRQVYQQEISRQALAINHSGRAIQTKRVLSRQPASIACDRSGNIVGIIFVLLRELDASLKLGSHAYFLRIYVCEGWRYPQLTNQLLLSFLKEFSSRADLRDHRASCLIAENINTRLHNSFIRKYFIKLGFQMLGVNDSASEIWSLKLKTSYIL